MPPSQREQLSVRATGRRGPISVVIAASGFGAVSVLTKLAYDAGAAPASLVVTRYVVAGLLLVPLAAPVLSRRYLREHRWNLVLPVGCGAGLAGGGFLEFEGLARLPAPTLVLLIFLAPVWVALGSWIFRRRRLGIDRVALLALVLIGIALLVGFQVGGANPSGVLLAVLASIIYGALFLLLERAIEALSADVVIAVVLVSAATTALCIVPSGPRDELGSASTAWLALAIGALTALSMWLLARGLSVLPALTTSVIATFEPVMAAILSWALLDEVLGAVQVLGGLAVIAGVVGISMREVGTRDSRSSLPASPTGCDPNRGGRTVLLISRPDDASRS